MSFRKRMNKIEAAGNNYHVVKIGYYTEIAFSTSELASKAYNAISKAVGILADKTFSNGNNSDTYKIVSPEELSERVSLVQMNLFTKDQVNNLVTWKSEVKCDGVPRGDGTMCGCWKSEKLSESGEIPEGWETYVLNSETKHMCPSCQDKDVKVEEVVVRTTNNC